MLACAESNFSNFKFQYLRENEFLRKTILACLSGAQMGLINEKSRVRKSRDTAPLTPAPPPRQQSNFFYLLQLHHLGNKTTVFIYSSSST